MKAILKANRLWHEGRADDTVCSSSHHVRLSDAESDAASDPGHARHVAYPIILQRLGEVPFACIM